MLILNVSYDLVNSIDEKTHQLSVRDIRGATEYLTIRGFTKKETIKLFCEDKGCRMIEQATVSVNTKTGAFHITREDDENIYIIFNEYYHVYLKEKNESRISLKNPLRVIEGKGNVNSSRDTLKYFTVPKSMHFWIEEFSGEYGKNVVSYIWDGTAFLVKENVAIGEVKASTDLVRNIITVTPDKNLFITDSTCTIEMFLKTYPNMYFRFLYEDFMDSIEGKYEDFERIIIVDIDREDDVEKQILKKAKNQLPLYICIPVYDYGSFHAVYEAIQVTE